MSSFPGLRRAPGKAGSASAGAPPAAPGGAASRRGAFCPPGPARGFPASQLRGVRRETRAGEETMPIATPRKWGSPPRGEETRGLGIAPVSEKRGGKDPVRSVRGWNARGRCRPEERSPRRGQREHRAAEPSPGSGGGIHRWGWGGTSGEICIFENRGLKTIMPRRQASCDVQHNVLVKYRNPPPNGGSCSRLH